MNQKNERAKGNTNTTNKYKTTSPSSSNIISKKPENNNGNKNNKFDNKNYNNKNTKKTWIQNPYLIAGVALGAVILISIAIFVINQLNKPSKSTLSNTASTTSTSSANSNQTASSIKTVAKTGTDFDAKKDLVVIEMQGGGIIKLELYPDQAPITVANFVKLVNEGFYDGLKFHRVMKGFMIQGGDPQGTGMGGSAKTLKGEFTQNGVKNTILHTKGVISMARSTSMDSASSQFFIMHGTETSLDGAYAAFGRVVDGIDVVDTIANVECDMSNPQSPSPLIPQIMKQVRIETRA